MPGGKTHFKKDWLLHTDGLGHKISSWCQLSNEVGKAFCAICKKTFRCDNQGLPQLLQHARGQSHKTLAIEILSGSQMVFAPTQSTEPGKTFGNLTTNVASVSTASVVSNQQETQTVKKQSSGTLQCISLKDEATKAELIWAMKVVGSHYSYASCDNINDTLEAMFPGKIPDNFTMSSSKVSYLVSEATGPYFKQVVADDVKNSGSPFTLQYDETTNAQVNKQLDIKIRYWSSAQSQVVVHHLQTYLMGHATGRQLAEKIISAVQDNGIALGQLQMLESDGPNVNKTVWNIVNDALLHLPNRNYGLTDIGTCNLHICHNAFAKGLEMFGSNISEFVIDLHLWFKMSAVRREEYEVVQEEMGLAKHKFLKHVECRWLSLQPAVLRILEQLEGLRRYFITVLPEKQSSISSNARYIRIRRQLESKDLVAQMHFLISVADIFNSFLKFFQSEEPLIHLLHDQLTTLLKMVMGRFIKKELLANKAAKGLSNISLEVLENHLAYKELEIGEQTRREIGKLSQENQKKFLLGAKSFLVAATKHLVNKLPLENVILRSCKVLKADAH